MQHTASRRLAHETQMLGAQRVLALRGERRRPVDALARRAPLDAAARNPRPRLGAIENRCASQRRRPSDGSAFFCAERHHAFDVVVVGGLGRQIAPIGIAGSGGRRRIVLTQIRRAAIGRSLPLAPRLARVACGLRLARCRRCISTASATRSTCSTVTAAACPTRPAPAPRAASRDRRASRRRARVDAQLAHARMHGVVEIELRQRGARRVNALGVAPPAASHSRARNACGSASNASRALTICCRTAASKQLLQLDRKPEAVEQLRTQLALFRIHRADQHEARVMPMRNAIALDGVHAARRRRRATASTSGFGSRFTSSTYSTP